MSREFTSSITSSIAELSLRKLNTWIIVCVWPSLPLLADMTVYNLESPWVSILEVKGVSKQSFDIVSKWNLSTCQSMVSKDMHGHLGWGMYMGVMCMIIGIATQALILMHVQIVDTRPIFLHPAPLLSGIETESSLPLALELQGSHLCCPCAIGHC